MWGVSRTPTKRGRLIEHQNVTYHYAAPPRRITVYLIINSRFGFDCLSGRNMNNCLIISKHAECGSIPDRIIFYSCLVQYLNVCGMIDGD